MKLDLQIMQVLFSDKGHKFSDYEGVAYELCLKISSQAKKIISSGKVYEFCQVDAKKISELIIKLHRLVWSQAMQLPNFNLSHIEPGFSYGHVARDLVNLVRLECENEVTVEGGLSLSVDYISGLIASISHDLGRVYINRFDDANRVVKTSEVSALILNHLLKDTDLPEEVKVMAVFGVMGNAHLVSSMTIKCEDGVERATLVYPHRSPHGHVLVCMKLPRNVHRLDCMGPTFAARHFLSKFNTVDKSGLDHTGFHTYPVEFAKHMQLRNLPRMERLVKRLPSTMIEHLSDFAFSQSPESNSPYIDGDNAQMAVLRDEMVLGLEMVLDEIQGLGVVDYKDVAAKYELFLWQTIDHSPASMKPAAQIMTAFKSLPEDVQKAYLRGFDMIMLLYKNWIKVAFFELMSVDSDILRLTIGNQEVFQALRIYEVTDPIVA